MAKETIKDKLLKQVEAGAAFLNVVFPNWLEKIDTKVLDLSESNVCMLGELYGNYGDGKEGLGIPSDEFAESLGFYLDRQSRYPLLTRIWKEKIRRLRRVKKPFHV